MPKRITIHDLIEEPLRVRGFAKVDHLLYKRSRALCVQSAAFGRRRDPRGGTWFSFGVGVFHAGVHELLWPDDHEPLPYTFGMPIHLLHPSRTFFEWTLSDSRETLQHSVLESFDTYGIPYMEELSDLQTVYGLLQSDAWMDSFVLDPVDRTLALAALETVLGDRAAAMFRLRQHVETFADDLPKKWLRAKRLLARLEADA